MRMLYIWSLRKDLKKVIKPGEKVPFCWSLVRGVVFLMYDILSWLGHCRLCYEAAAVVVLVQVRCQSRCDHPRSGTPSSPSHFLVLVVLVLVLMLMLMLMLNLAFMLMLLLLLFMLMLMPMLMLTFMTLRFNSSTRLCSRRMRSQLCWSLTFSAPSSGDFVASSSIPSILLSFPVGAKLIFFNFYWLGIRIDSVTRCPCVSFGLLLSSPRSSRYDLILSRRFFLICRHPHVIISSFKEHSLIVDGMKKLAIDPNRQVWTTIFFISFQLSFLFQLVAAVMGALGFIPKYMKQFEPVTDDRLQQR